MIRDWPGLILRLTAARGWDGRLCSRVFLLGASHESRVTIVAQQIRAINLAWALHRTGRLNATVAVVGAGAAGATFAAAASLLGADVTLFDEHEEPISTQRWSFDRHLHPNLFDWPLDGWDEPRANLPVVDWSAGPSAAARLEMLADFSLAAARGGVKLCSQHSVSEVRPVGEEVRVTVCDLRSAAEEDVRVAVSPFDLVVVASGFLPEPQVAHTRVSGSYWQDVDLEDVLGSAEVNHTIVGDGDGALTELLRLTFGGWARLGTFHQSMLTGLGRSLLEQDGLGADVLAVEAAVSGGRGESTLQAYADDRFASADETLRSLLRTGSHGAEVRAGRVASRRNAFALNRFLAARLTRVADVRYVLGEPFAEEAVGALAPSAVVWRTGTRPRRRTELVRPALGVRDAGDALARDPAHQDVLGTVDDLMDASREPRWDERARAKLSRRADGSALAAAADIESGGLDASGALPWKPSVWPAFVDEPPLLALPSVIRDLAYLAVTIDNARSPRMWSNFRITPRGVELSLDLVAAAAHLTPTEVVDELRRQSATGIDLALVDVERGMNIRRVWVRVAQGDLARAEPRWTYVSLLLAPGFAEGDSVHDDERLDFDWHEPPRTGDGDLDRVAKRVLDERKLTMALPITDSGTRAMPRDEVATPEHDARSERAFLTVMHRRLGGAEDFEFRSSLVALANHVLERDEQSPLVDAYLEHVLRLTDGDRGAALLRAAFGKLVCRDPATGELEPMALDEPRLRRELREGVVPPDEAEVPDLSAFAVYVPPTEEEEPR